MKNSGPSSRSGYRRRRHSALSGAPTGLLCILSVLLFSACSGKKILEEQALIKDQALSVLAPSSTGMQLVKGVPAGKKFHLGVRVSEAFMNRAATELLKAEVVPSKFENPVAITIPPFGTKVALRPSISLREPKLSFTGACDECVSIATKFVGKLAVDLNSSGGSAATRLVEGNALSGDILLRARLIPLMTGGHQSLGIQIEPITDNDLSISVNVPVPGIDTLITSAVRSQIRNALSIPRLNTFPLISMKAVGVPGSMLKVSEINYVLLTKPESELFVGVVMNLKTLPEISLDDRGRKLRGSDFVVLAGENSLTDAIRVWMAEGLVPGTYDTSGNPNPKGEAVIELKRMDLFEDHYEIYARMWHIGTPPFWREYKLSGVMGVRSDEVTIKNEKAEVVAKAGPNALIDLALKLQNVSLNKALEGVGSRMPRQVGLPFGTPAKLTASVGVEELQTDKDRLTVYGQVDFSVPGEPARGAGGRQTAPTRQQPAPQATPAPRQAPAPAPAPR